MRSHELAHIGDQFNELGLGLAAADDERARDFELVVRMERRCDASVGFDDVRSRLLSFAAAAGHGWAGLCYIRVMEMEDFGRREGFLMQMQMIVGRSFDFVARLCGSEALKADRLLAGKLKDTYERYGALERYENLLDQQKIQKPF